MGSLAKCSGEIVSYPRCGLGAASLCSVACTMKGPIWGTTVVYGAMPSKSTTKMVREDTFSLTWDRTAQYIDRTPRMKTERIKAGRISNP